jgi:four helix bundle protein
MAKFSRFEDILAWQKARVLTSAVYELSKEGGLAKDFDLRSQLRRSCVSIMANIAEGQGRRTDKDFANFLNISLGSIAETKSHLYVAQDLGYVDKPTFVELYAKLDELGRMVFSLSNHLRTVQRSSASASNSPPTS